MCSVGEFWGGARSQAKGGKCKRKEEIGAKMSKKKGAERKKN